MIRTPCSCWPAKFFRRWHNLSAMDFELSSTEKAFRDEVRAWLKANAPRDGNGEGDGDMKSFIESRRRWQKKLYEAGYVGMTWPAEYGGRGRTFIGQLLFYDEMILAPPPQPIHVIRLGLGGSRRGPPGRGGEKKGQPGP